MDKAKRILALLAVILLGGMYVAALIFSLMSSDRAQVYFRAALAGTVLKIMERSFLSLFLRMPQWMPFAKKPVAAQTPPSMNFMGSSSL